MNRQAITRKRSRILVRSYNERRPKATAKKADKLRGTAQKGVVGRPFQKGHDPRRNLNGRPKKRTLSDAVRDALQEVIDSPFGDGETPTVDVIAKAIMRAGQDSRGGGTAWREIRELTEPKRVTIDANIQLVTELRQLLLIGQITYAQIEDEFGRGNPVLDGLADIARSEDASKPDQVPEPKK